MVASERLDQLARLDNLLRIQSGGRFVEHEDVRVVENGLGQAHPLPVTLRELAAVAIRHIAHACPRHRLVDPPLPLR